MFTEIGLIVAIAALTVANHFQFRTFKLMSQRIGFAEERIVLLEKQMGGTYETRHRQ